MSTLFEGDVAVVVAVVLPSRLSRSWRALSLSVSGSEGLVLVLPLPRSVVRKRGLWMRLAGWVGSMDCL